MEMAIMRANIVEDREATMARFLAGLNTEIANVVKLQHYVELEDMVHMAIKVEKQQRRKTVNRGNTPSKPFSNSFNAPNNFRKPAAQAPLQVRERAESSKPKPPVADVGRGKQPMHQEHSGEIESESEEDEPILPRETVQEEDDTLQSFETGDVLVIKRSLTTQPTQDNQQRENIFHTRCLVNNKVCVVIIDGGSCTNVASSIMVEKLSLKTTKQPNPYRLQWLNDGGEIKVNKQFDKCTLHDGVTNRYSFMHVGQKITLAPLTPSQVQEDQVRLRNNMEEAKEKKKIEREKEDSNAKVLSIPTSSSNFSNLQVSALFPKEVPKVASVGRLRTFMCLTEIQQPSLPRFDVPFSFATDFSPLPVKSSSCKLDFVSSDVFLIDCRGHDCCLEFCIIVCRFDNVQRALSVFMLCIIRKGTRTKASLAPSDSEFLVEVWLSIWEQIAFKKGDDVSTSSSAHIADPEVLPQGLVTRERTRIQELKPSSVEARRFVCSSFQLNEADTPSASSIQLNTAPFSSTSAPLAQLKPNNPEAAETRPANMFTSILTSRRYKEVRFTGCPVSDSEKEDQEPPNEDVGDDVQLAETGEVLVCKRSLNAQPMQDDQQRETIFHTRCLVNDKVCNEKPSFILDSNGGSCTNVASILMVDKLGLKTTKHLEPYKLQWLNNGDELEVTKQVVVPFSIGRYKDEVKCDVCPMDACHLLLRRSWQYDRRVLHHCFTNRYSFDHEGKKVILTPMSPNEVYEDQIRLKTSIAAWKASKEKITCDNKESHTKVIFASTSSLISSPNLQAESRAPGADSKVASVGERTRIQELKPSSVEAQRFVCSSFQLNEADTTSASSIQLNTAPFSSTSAPLAQLKLNNPEAAETRPAEVKEYDVGDLSLARLKFRSSYAARFSSTKCHTSAS
ncbi:hypothetical protein GQ457_18G009550 [Hibiscus cannabinus]